MAFNGNGQIASRKSFVGDLLKHEYAPEHGFCREVVDSATDLVIGQVVKSDGTVVADGEESQAYGVVLTNFSAEIGTEKMTPFHDDECVALVRGPAIIAEEALVLEANVTVAELKAVLEPKGILIRPADQAPALAIS